MAGALADLYQDLGSPLSFGYHIGDAASGADHNFGCPKI